MPTRKEKAPEAPVLDFERPVVELQRKIATLKGRSRASSDLAREIRRIEERAEGLQRRIFSELSPWQKVQLARHPGRPYTLDYLARIIGDFRELHGDRSFADDSAMIGGIGYFEGIPVVVLGQQKGRKTKEKLARNLGMVKPEGYRKSMRLMQLAARFRHPVLCLLDTPGAFPGIDAEERGQAEAVAKSLEVMASLPVPIVSVVIGEGGSGGALAIGVADRVMMLENAVYSVISPEGCASILFRSDERKAEAAAAMKVTAPEILRLGVIDEIIPEAPGGAHRDFDATARNLAAAIRRALDELMPLSPQELKNRRYEKYRRMGAFVEAGGRDRLS
ncbi:MAG: acetyl-CoA carboxylase carboxyltransferase subunit alpha [Deltaproteobacteria bacterium]|nr:acetyl-CoA carboxylase carboxyltransferase subunit alpha [Deltaproteobacteria bacterium]